MRDGDAVRGPIVAFVLTSVTALLWSLPAPAVAADVEVLGFESDGAEAVFESFDGCARRTAVIRPLDSRSRANGAGTTEVSSVLVHLLRSDPCRDTFDSRIGRVDLAADDFRVRPDLGYASLRAHIDLRDRVAGQTIPLALDLTWRSDGEVGRDGERSRIAYPDGSTWITRVTRAMRDAVATGSISDGANDYAADGPSSSANMSVTRTGFVIMRAFPNSGPR